MGMYFLSSYFYLGHFSRYLLPGARRIAVSSSHDALETVGFANPDGNLVVVVLNQFDDPVTFRLQCADTGVMAEAIGHSITTFAFQNCNPGDGDVPGIVQRSSALGEVGAVSFQASAILQCKDMGLVVPAAFGLVGALLFCILTRQCVA